MPGWVSKHIKEHRGTGLSGKERNVCWWDKNIQLTKARKNTRKSQKGRGEQQCNDLTKQKGSSGSRIGLGGRPETCPKCHSM